MPLEYRRLGESDLCVSSIGLGCVTFGREIDEVTSFRVLDRAMEREINLLDTAAAYGNGASESIIGRWLRDRKIRENIILATKVSGQLTHQNIVDSVEGSLQRLAIDRIDLLQAHGWDDQTPVSETLQAFNQLVRQGKVRFCGVSNWSADQLCHALGTCRGQGWIRLESMQPIYNLVDRRIERKLLPYCVENRVGVISYSPLGAGFLTGKYRINAPIPMGTRFDVIPGHRRIYFTDHGFRAVESLREAADRINLPMFQVALAWVLQRPGITSVLIGARTADQVDQAFESLRLELPEPECQRLDAIEMPNY